MFPAPNAWVGRAQKISKIAHGRRREPKLKSGRGIVWQGRRVFVERMQSVVSQASNKEIGFVIVVVVVVIVVVVGVCVGSVGIDVEG